MVAALDGQRQTGEKVSETRVCEIGLGSSFRRWVTANAVAVAAMQEQRENRRCVASHRGAIVGRAYRPQPDYERSQPNTEPGRDHIARLGNVQQLDPAEREHAREAEPKRVLGNVQREPAREPDSGDGADQQPRHRVQVDVALHEVPEAGNPQQSGCVKDVRADDPRDRSADKPAP